MKDTEDILRIEDERELETNATRLAFALQSKDKDKEKELRVLRTALEKDMEKELVLLNRKFLSEKCTARVASQHRSKKSRGITFGNKEASPSATRTTPHCCP